MFRIKRSRARALTAVATTAGLMLVSIGLASSAVAAPGTATISASPAEFVASETVKISADFPTSRPYLNLETDGGTGSWTAVQTHKKADSKGKYTFSLRPAAAEKVRVVEEKGSNQTGELDLTPVATTGELDPITANSSGTSAAATARFTPARKDQTTSLQALTIVSTKTDEMPAAKWRTIAASKQDSQGGTKFSISDPMEISHSYRAVTAPSGGSISTESNEITFASPATTKNTGLSTVYFNSNEGNSVNTRDRYFEGTFTMTASDKVTECAAVPTQTKATMKGRGNYSWSFSKKSFTFKLDKKTDLCGMGKGKKWALISNAYDKSLLRSSAAFNLGSKLDNMAFTSQGKPVDLYVNGSYRGSYFLVETVGIDENRVNIDRLKNGPVEDPSGANDSEPNITGGYLLEWDFRKGGDHNVKVGSRGYVGIKDPEDEDDGSGITKKQISYIDGYLDGVDAVLYGSNFTSDSKGWKAYIDEKSAVDYYIAQEIMKPVDGQMWASVYMYKPRSGKLQFGPMWDYDLSSGSANRAGGTVSPTGWYLRNKVNTSAKQASSTWFNRLNEDPDFRAAVAKRWKEVYPQLKTNDAFLGSQASTISKSADANFSKWSIKERISSAQVVKGSYSKEVSYTRDWLKTRISWMNTQY